MIDDDWESEAKALVAAGDHRAAYRLLRAIGKSGREEAFVRLAVERWIRRKFAEADRLLAEVSRRALEHDVDTQVALHSAISLGVGDFGTLERWRLAFQHLLAAAWHEENWYSRVKVASHYEFGLNGVPKDLAAAGSWMALAAATGIPEGIREKEKFAQRNRNKQPAGAQAQEN
jgi:hypothetical protein